MSLNNINNKKCVSPATKMTSIPNHMAEAHLVSPMSQEIKL